MDDRHRLIDRAACLLKRNRNMIYSLDRATDTMVHRILAGKDPLTGRTLPTPAWIGD